MTRRIAAIGLCLLLSACSDDDEVALNTVRREPTPASTIAAAPTTTTTTIPTITRDTRLTLEGLGPVVIGSTPEEVEANSDLEVVFAYTAGTGEGNERCAVSDIRGGPLGLSVMTIGDEIRRIDVADNSAVQTLSGLQIGDTAATVKRLYPTARRTPHQYVAGGFNYTYESTSPSGRALLVEVDNKGLVTSFRAGFSEEVSYPEGCA